MQIWLNSNLINIADDTNLAQLIESQNYDSNRVAAEVDMQIVPRTIWNSFNYYIIIYIKKTIKAILLLKPFCVSY